MTPEPLLTEADIPTMEHKRAKDLPVQTPLPLIYNSCLADDETGPD